MTIARQLQKDLLFVAGCVLTLLGAGNYIAGDSKVAHYQAVIAESAPRTPAAPPFFSRGKQAVFPSEGRERLEIARAKLDFYQVVLSSGRLMLSTGIGCVLIAFLRLRRQSVARSRRKWLSVT
ncbi:MAG: hypothetical protein AB1671_08765 [Thermodesulfobacteriota bacterium]|jgi:hypothetical protein